MTQSLYSRHPKTRTDVGFYRGQKGAPTNSRVAPPGTCNNSTEALLKKGECGDLTAHIGFMSLVLVTSGIDKELPFRSTS